MTLPFPKPPSEGGDDMNTHATPRPAPLMALHARTAAGLMTHNPVSVRRTATVEDAARFLSSRGISAAPVIDDAGRPVGVVSRTDLLNRRRLHVLDSLPEGPPRGFAGISKERVSAVMTPAVFCVRLGTPAGKVVEKMLALRVRRLFVVDSDGALVGVVSAFDVLNSLRPLPAAGEG
jgi:CBS domain-containing protein